MSRGHFLWREDVPVPRHTEEMFQNLGRHKGDILASRRPRLPFPNPRVSLRCGGALGWEETTTPPGLLAARPKRLLLSQIIGMINIHARNLDGHVRVPSPT